MAALELADIQQNGREGHHSGTARNLKQKGDSAILCYLLGSSLIRNGAQPGSPEYTEARAVFQKAIRLDPKLPYPYIELGKMYEQSGKVLEAIPLFEKAAALGPRNPSAYYHLARDYQKLNQPQKAEQMLNKLKEIDQSSREFERMGLTKPEGIAATCLQQVRAVQIHKTLKDTILVLNRRDFCMSILAVPAVTSGISFGGSGCS